jgi:hypothetical protein
MATVTFNKIFVNLVATGQAVSGYSARGRTEKYVQGGEVRTYANGRRRSIATEEDVGTYGFQLLLVPRTTVDTLTSWRGLLVQVRDHKGRLFYGVYRDATVEEIVSRAAWNVATTLTVVTFDPSV